MDDCTHSLTLPGFWRVDSYDCIIVWFPFLRSCIKVTQTAPSHTNFALRQETMLFYSAFSRAAGQLAGRHLIRPTGFHYLSTVSGSGLSRVAADRIAQNLEMNLRRTYGRINYHSARGNTARVHTEEQLADMLRNVRDFVRG